MIFKNYNHNNNSPSQSSLQPQPSPLIQPLTHTHKLGPKQFQTFLHSQPHLSTLIFSIQKYLSDYQPNNYHFYYNALLMYCKGRSLDAISAMLQQQYSKMTRNKSFLHIINNAVLSRFRCMQKIKRDLTKVQAVLQMFKKCYFHKGNQENNVYLEYTVNEGYTVAQIDHTIQASIAMINALFLDLSRLRDMTLYLVETVHKWKVEREQWLDRCKCHSRVDFYIKNQEQQQDNIILYQMIRKDTDFLWTSKLCQYIWLQHKNDPLLIRNVLTVSQKQTKQILQKYFLQILYPNSQQLIDKIIKAVDMLNFKYKPIQVNLYEQQQKLIQNYLSLKQKQRQQNGYEDQQQENQARQVQLIENDKSRVKSVIRSRVKKSLSQSKIVSVKKQFSSQIQSDFKKWNNPTSQILQNSPYSNKSPQKQSARGWVFGKQLKKPSTQKIRDIIKKHEIQMVYLKNHKNIIKPFNITNYSQRKSIALAYISQKNIQPIRIKKDSWVNKKQEDSEPQIKINRNQPHSDGQYRRINDRVTQSDSQQNKRKLYQSLVRINSVIQQDPKQHQMDQQTPKNKNKKQSNMESNKNRFFLQKPQKTQNQSQLSKTIDKKDVQPSRVSSSSRKIQSQKSNLLKNQKNLSKPKQNNIKINTLIFNNKKQQQQLSKQILQQAEIQVDQQQTPLNFKQFFQVFRADTTTKNQSQSRASNQMIRSIIKNQQIKQLAGSIPVRKAIDRKRAQSLKNMNIALLPYYSQKKKKPTLQNKNNNEKSINNKSKNKNQQNSFQSYSNVPITHLNQKQKSQSATNIQNSIPSSIIKPDNKQHLKLTSKQVPKDLIAKYVRHLCSTLPISCQSFTNYHTMAYQGHIIQLLQDSTMNSLIFQIEGQKDGKVGQAIIVQTLSSTMKMRYTIQFINIGKFQLLMNSICRIAQELLATSPCQEVVLKLVQDKADPVSTHFIALIDSSLHALSHKFSYFHILQKQILGLTHQNLHERVYFFQTKTKNLMKQQINQKFKNQFKRKRMPGSSYRSLVFQIKSVVMTSNFKLRSQNLNKPIVQIYREQAIGLLYVLLLQKIMTKYHLKQLKIASLSLSDDETTGLVKKNPFLRSLFFSLLQILKKSSKSQLPSHLKSAITKFTTMTDLLNYLSYKQLDQVFKFDFLVQSRFILNHQLTLSEISLSASLDFVLENGVNMIIMNNHHHFIIQQVVRMVGVTKDSSFRQNTLTGYLLPTTQDHLKLFLMSAKQYYSCSDNLDIYSYIQLLFKQSLIRQNHQIEQIAIPDLTKRKQKLAQIKMYEGLIRLFPQRQFYSASSINIQNLWQNYYPNAVISMPSKNAIILQYPIIIGFFDTSIEMPIVMHVLKTDT